MEVKCSPTFTRLSDVKEQLCRMKKQLLEIY